MLIRYTDAGIRTVKQLASLRPTLRALVEQLGGKAVGSYVTQGQYDGVLTVDKHRAEAGGGRLDREEGVYGCAPCCTMVVRATHPSGPPTVLRANRRQKDNFTLQV
jgi:hypothetical protein